MMKSKKTNYKFWHSPMALIFLFSIIILFGYKIFDLVKKERETSHIKEGILDDLSILKRKEAYLLKDLSKLETEEGKEEIIREKYPYVKEGEKMVTIIDESIDNASLLEDENDGHGFWNWLKGVLGVN